MRDAARRRGGVGRTALRRGIGAAGACLVCIVGTSPAAEPQGPSAKPSLPTASAPALPASPSGSGAKPQADPASVKTAITDAAVPGEPVKEKRVGIIGLDTSHVTAFAGALNKPDKAAAFAGFRVTAAFPGGSADIPSSRDRVAGFTETLRDKHQVRIVASIPELLAEVDCVLLESVDGRPHLEQARPVIEAGKPLFIDKPLAGSLADAVELLDLAKARGVPVFSSSGLRFSPGIVQMKSDPKVGKIVGVDAFSPCSLEEHHPDLFWYGVHGVETLYTLMGTGCRSVTRVHNPGVDHVVGTWADGRVGTFRGIRNGKANYGATVYGENGIAPSGGFGGYDPLIAAVCGFFATGRSPVPPEETLEILAFMEAADESKRQAGAPVTLESVLEKARKTVAERTRH